MVAYFLTLEIKQVNELCKFITLQSLFSAKLVYCMLWYRGLFRTVTVIVPSMKNTDTKNE